MPDSACWLFIVEYAKHFEVLLNTFEFCHEKEIVES